MIDRNIYPEQINAGFKYNPVVVLMGARQVGKTSLMDLYTRDKKHLWLNGQNPEIGLLFESFSVIERFLKLNINENLDGLVIIDEFQFIPDISLMLKLITDKYKAIKILCSGSSSIEINQKMDESLAGRVRIIPVYALDFNEYLKFTAPNVYELYNKCQPGDNINLLIPQIQSLLSEYLTYGGLPKIALAKELAEKRELLDDIFQTYLLKDVRQYIKQLDFIAFNKLLRILSAQTGNLVNINELSSTVKLPYRACEEYISLLEQMFVIHLVNPFTTNKRAETTKMKKIYFCDTGLRNIIYNDFNDISFRTDNGQLFENFVYLQLLKSFKKEQIYYYRTKDGTEIDFVLFTDGRPIPIEVKYKEFVKLKKIRALTGFLQSTEGNFGYVINKNLIGQGENHRYIQPYQLGKTIAK